MGSQKVNKVKFIFEEFHMFFKVTRSAIDVGCNMCFWFLSFRTGALGKWSQDGCSLSPNVGRVQLEMSCMYTEADADSECREEVTKLRSELLNQSVLNGGENAQYVNTPSCQDEKWASRYFGLKNYNKLLKLKETWDPLNLFHYCQSVGSDNHNCC